MPVPQGPSFYGCFPGTHEAHARKLWHDINRTLKKFRTCRSKVKDENELDAAESDRIEAHLSWMSRRAAAAIDPRLGFGGTTQQILESLEHSLAHALMAPPEERMAQLSIHLVLAKCFRNHAPETAQHLEKVEALIPRMERLTEYQLEQLKEEEQKGEELQKGQPETSSKKDSAEKDGEDKDS